MSRANTPPPMPPPIGRTVRRRVGVLRAALWGIGCCFAGAIAILTLVVVGMDLGPLAFHLTMILAFLPVPIYVMMVLWLDRIEKEPWYLLLVAFLYGATFATCLGGLFNVTVARVLGQSAAIVFSAPVFEELFKGIFILGIFLFRKHEFDGVLDGVIYASMVGLGFATVENIEYYGRVIREVGVPHGGGPMSVAGIFIIRGVFSPFAHPLFTSMIGIGFGLSVRFKNPGMRLLLPLLGYFAAVGLHAAWNTSALVGGFAGFAGAYLIVFVPTFIGLIILTQYSLWREANLVREHLMHEVSAGRLSAADYRAVSSLAARREDLAAALRFGGRAFRDARRRFHHAISDLAFYRYRVKHGITPHDPHLEADHFQTLSDICTTMARHWPPAAAPPMPGRRMPPPAL